MLEEIKTRRSVRKFTSEHVDEKIVDQILEMGTWAPSGLNNQPWKFLVIQDQRIREQIATKTKYSRIIQNAPICIAVFLDNSESYDRIKDIQAVGACIQNMLLTIHSLGLGGVWLGEILNNRESVEEILEAAPEFELMAVIAFGHPAEKKGKGRRKGLAEVVINRI